MFGSLARKCKNNMMEHNGTQLHMNNHHIQQRHHSIYITSWCITWHKLPKETKMQLFDLRSSLATQSQHLIECQMGFGDHHTSPNMWCRPPLQSWSPHAWPSMCCPGLRKIPGRPNPACWSTHSAGWLSHAASCTWHRDKSWLKWICYNIQKMTPG